MILNEDPDSSEFPLSIVVEVNPTEPPAYHWALAVVMNANKATKTNNFFFMIKDGISETLKCFYVIVFQRYNNVGMLQ